MKYAKYLFLGFFVAAAIAAVAYAMAPMQLCYYSAPGVCTNVTSSTPLPVYIP